MTLDPKTLEAVARMFHEEAARGDDYDPRASYGNSRAGWHAMAARVRAMAPKVEDGPALVDLAAAFGAPSSDDPVAHVMAYVGQPRRATREECLAAFTDQPRTAEQERADVVAQELPMHSRYCSESENVGCDCGLDATYQRGCTAERERIALAFETEAENPEMRAHAKCLRASAAFVRALGPAKGGA